MKHVHFVPFFFLHRLHCHKKYVLFVLSKSCIAMNRALFEPEHGIMLLIEYTNSDGSDAPAHPHSLTTDFASIKLDEGSDQVLPLCDLVPGSIKI